MVLRLIEIVLPEDEKEDLEKLLTKDDLPVLGVWIEPMLGIWERPVGGVWKKTFTERQILVKLLVSTEEAETVIDLLEKRFHRTEACRLVVLPVAASLPRPELAEEEPETKTLPEEKPKKKSRRIGREELYADLAYTTGLSEIYVFMVILSSIVAAIGVLRDNVAVIIGAMLVAPLMSPIVSSGMGIVTGDIQMLRSALSSTLQGVLLAIFLGIISTLVSPLATATSEVLARTRPNLLDLLVALVSGVAGAYAIGRKEVGAALPGVAIAAALVPPVAAIGVGIALGSLSVALGAALLFTTNLVAIIFSSAITFLLLGMRPPKRPDRQRWLRQGLIVSVALLLLISIPLGVVLFQAASVSRIEGQAQDIVQQTVDEWSSALTGGGQAALADFNVDVGWRNVSITGTLYTTGDISSADMNALNKRLESELHRKVDIELFVLQGTRLTNDSQP